MDPGTALAVVGLSLQVIVEIKEYYKLWKGYDDDVQRLREKLDRLAEMIEGLRPTLEKPTLDSTLVSRICRGCKRLKQNMGEMTEVLEKLRSEGSPSKV